MQQLAVSRDEVDARCSQKEIFKGIIILIFLQISYSLLEQVIESE